MRPNFTASQRKPQIMAEAQITTPSAPPPPSAVLTIETSSHPLHTAAVRASPDNAPIPQTGKLTISKVKQCITFHAAVTKHLTEIRTEGFTLVPSWG